MPADPLHRKLLQRTDALLGEFTEALTEYARVPTISAHGAAFEEGAAATQKVLERAGAQVRRYTADGGPPVVVGEVESDPARPWVILYNHYDVQPVDPVDEWTSEPFSPQVRDGRIYARGVSDTKGNTVAQALAVRALREEAGHLPVNVRFLVEGEEESGSPHLEALTREHPELFRGAGATIEATARSPDGRPVVALGSKGVASFELEVRTARVDQHSSLAVLVPNAAWRLVAALRTLRRDDGKVLIDGFLDGVDAPDPEMLRYLRRNSFDPARYQDEYGVTSLLVKGSRFVRLRRAYYSPTCTINGLVSGYTGPGSKTVNPAVARAKLDLRLLPGQTAAVARDRLVAHLKARGFEDVQVRASDGFPPASTPVSSPFAQATLRAAKKAYGAPPNVVPWSLGSSTTAYFTRAGTPALEPPGVGNSGSRAHAPNENVRLEDVPPSMLALATLLLGVGTPPAPA